MTKSSSLESPSRVSRFLPITKVCVERILLIAQILLYHTYRIPIFEMEGR